MKIVLIVNDLHGFPSALRKNASRSQPWATTVCEECVLTRTDKVGSFEDSIVVSGAETIFHAVQQAGGETVLLGSSPPHWRQPCPTVHANTYELPDPRCELYLRGVNRCSLYEVPSHQRNGCASVYDDDVCDQACDILQSFSGTYLLLWVNLSCFEDLERIQLESTTAGRAESTCVPPPPSMYDRRSLPLSVSTVLDGISEPSRRTEHQYVTLLEAATRLFDRHRDRVARIVENALSREGDDVSVAYTSTHSLSIGEHAVRGGHAPLGTCCETFWLSNVVAAAAATSSSRPCLHDLIVSMVTHPATPSLTTVTECRHDYYRHVIRVDDHLYSCVVRHERILHVFDLSSDPEETHDVYSSLGHLHAEFARRVATTSRPTPERDNPVAAVPEVHVRIPSPTEEATVRPIARQPSFSRRPNPPSQTSTSTRTKVGVRQTEARLNKMHR